VDGLLWFQRLALDNVDEFVELAKDLDHNAMVTIDHERHSAKAFLLTVARVEGGKAESASAE
jgi:hypothetical protein